MQPTEKLEQWMRSSLSEQDVAEWKKVEPELGVYAAHLAAQGLLSAAETLYAYAATAPPVPIEAYHAEASRLSFKFLVLFSTLKGTPAFIFARGFNPGPVLFNGIMELSAHHTVVEIGRRYLRLMGDGAFDSASDLYKGDLSHTFAKAFESVFARRVAAQRRGTVDGDGTVAHIKKLLADEYNAAQQYLALQRASWWASQHWTLQARALSPSGTEVARVQMPSKIKWTKILAEGPVAKVINDNPGMVCREIAARVGCCPSLVIKTKAWAEEMERRDQERNVAPRAVSLTKKHEDTLDAGEALARLIAASDRDRTKGDRIRKQV